MSNETPSFSGIVPWLETTWQEILRREQGVGLPHAMLFAGHQGLGKRALADKLVQRLLCKTVNQDKQQMACGHCQSCKLIMAGTHPDFLLCQHEAKGKQIKIDEVRKVNDFLSKTPQIAQTKVVLVYPLEAMNINSANALLKTLEEPAGNSYLLLLAERLGSVLPTIKSRAQKITIPVPERAQAVDWLCQQSWQGKEAGLSPEQLKAQSNLALDLNGNAPLSAQQWLSSEAGEDNLVMFNVLHDWLSGQKDLISCSKQLMKFELVFVLDWWLTLTVDMLKVMLQGQPYIAHKNQADWIVQMSGNIDKQQLFVLQEKLQEVGGRLAQASGNYNQQLLLESLLLKWRETCRLM